MCSIVDRFPRELEWVSEPENDRFITAGEAYAAICLELNTKINIVELIHLKMYHVIEYTKYDCVEDYPEVSSLLHKLRVERLKLLPTMGKEEYENKCIEDFNSVMELFLIPYREEKETII